MLLYHLSCLALYVTILSWTCAQSVAANGGKAIIIDTDIFADVDDVGALAIANILHNCGLADLKAVMINTSSMYGALAVSAINTYFNNGHIPIAALRPLTQDMYQDTAFFSTAEYASKLAMNFPRTLNDSSTTPSPLELYTSILKEAEDDSVTIISIGFLTDIAELLTSKTTTSNITALLERKVSELVIMGGAYPSGHEYNFYTHSHSTSLVLQHFPATIPKTFIGFELGLHILSGPTPPSPHLPSSPSSSDNSPILASYQWYVARCRTLRESWDPLTVLYAILGLSATTWEKHLNLTPPFAYANSYGYNSIVSSSIVSSPSPSSDGGWNEWVNDTSVTNQRWLKLADGVSNASVADILNQFYMHDPMDKSCFGGGRHGSGSSVGREGEGMKSEL